MLLTALALGFMAWGSAVWAIHRSIRLRRSVFWIAISGILCAASMLCALWQVKYWVRQEDVIAILDCSGGLFFGGSVLTVVEGVLLLIASFCPGSEK